MAGKDVLKTMKHPWKIQDQRIPADWGIEYFLTHNGSATTTKIMKHLRENGAEYTLPGLLKVLARMESRKIIKIDKSRKPLVVSLRGKTYAGDNVEHTSFLFSSHASDLILKTQLSASDFNSSEENMLDDIVIKAGVYSVYSQLIGWELATSMGKTDDERLEIQRKWLKNMGEIQKLSTYFDFLFKIIFEEDGIRFGTRFSNYDKKLIKIKKLQKVLRQKYPEIMKSLRQAFANLPEIQSKYEEAVELKKELKDFEEYKKTLERKRKKEPVYTVPRNTCPRCHFNGKRAIRAGPFKGMKISVRSITPHKIGNMEYWLCPQCEFSVPIS